MHFRTFFLYQKCCKIRNNTPICILNTERTPNYDIIFDFSWFRCNKIMWMVFEWQNLFLCHQKFHYKNILWNSFPNTKFVNNVHTKLNQSAFWNCALFLILVQQKNGIAKIPSILLTFERGLALLKNFLLKRCSYKKSPFICALFIKKLQICMLIWNLMPDEQLFMMYIEFACLIFAK